MKILNYFKENIELLKENTRMRRGKKEVEIAYSDIQQKYINLLEWKSEQYDLYLKYQEQCEELIKDKRDLKKQFAEANEMINSLTNIKTELENQIEKLEKKVKKTK